MDEDELHVLLLPEPLPVLFWALTTVVSTAARTSRAEDIFFILTPLEF
jgi:hypothetical protein